MTDARAKYVPASISEVSFNCPHCGALTTQYWHSVHTEPLRKNNIPKPITAEELEEFDLNKFGDDEKREEFLRWFNRATKGRPFLEPSPKNVDYNAHNLYISRCYSCDEVCIWLRDHLIWPALGEAPLPNPDMPDDVKLDYEEAAQVLGASPRGAAALLRLCVQKICNEIGEEKKTIDQNIAAFVENGLDKTVQQALDIVRVTGNNAVHPGQMDLKDDVGTAESLFELVNMIVDAMVTRPMRVEKMYEKLPEGARKAIEKRDGNKPHK